MNNENKVLKILDKVVFYMALAIFAFCLGYAVVCYFTGVPSPVYGYDEYTLTDLVERVSAILLILLPVVLKKLGLRFPLPVLIVYNAFIVITVFCGTFAGLYINTGWWDKFNHTLSGFLLGIAGMFFVNSATKGSEKVNPFTAFVIVFSVAVMCGAVWEIYEFTCDGILDSNMQHFMNDHTLEQFVGRAALADTMGDIIVDAVGALVAGVLAAVMAVRDRSFFDMFAVRFERKSKKALKVNDVSANEEAAATAVTDDSEQE